MKKHNINLDILRGFAALSVVLYHLDLLSKVFDSKYTINVIQYVFPGHLSVLVFFILSGYVIGVNTPRFENAARIKDYLKKRFVRIVPIYMVAILVTLWVVNFKYDLITSLSNIFLVSVPMDNVIPENGPLWSLEYELFYYLAFVPILFLKIDFRKMVVGVFVAVIALFLINLRFAVNPLLIGIVIGFLFWITGAFIARLTNTIEWKINDSRIVAVFLFLFALQRFNPYEPLMKALHLNLKDNSPGHSEFQQTITYFDFYYYPLAVILILSLTKIYHRFSAAFVYMIYFFSFGILCSIPFSYGWHRLIEKQYIVAAAIILTSFALWQSNKNFKPNLVATTRKTAWLSNISYAIYIVHSPLIYLFGMYQATSGMVFLAKILAFMVVLIASSYFLEMIYQPKIKKLLLKKR